MPPALFFLKIILAIKSPLTFHMNFGIFFSVSAKHNIGILIENVLNLQIAQGIMGILTKLTLAIREHGIFSHRYGSFFISFNVLGFFWCVDISLYWLVLFLRILFCFALFLIVSLFLFFR